MHLHPIAATLEIGAHRKFELVYENLLERGNVVLFIKQQIGFFVVCGIYGPKRQWAVVVMHEDGIDLKSFSSSKIDLAFTQNDALECGVNKCPDSDFNNEFIQFRHLFK